MCLILDKDAVEMEIVRHIPTTEGVFPPAVPASEIINTILLKFKDRDSI